MSYCTIALVKGNVVKLKSVHYTEIHAWIKEADDINFENENNETTFIGCGHFYSDTGLSPAVIMNFNEKAITSTKYNWFDFYDQDVPKGWTFKSEEEIVKVEE